MQSRGRQVEENAKIFTMKFLKGVKKLENYLSRRKAGIKKKSGLRSRIEDLKNIKKVMVG